MMPDGHKPEKSLFVKFGVWVGFEGAQKEHVADSYADLHTTFGIQKVVSKSKVVENDNEIKLVSRMKEEQQERRKVNDDFGSTGNQLSF